MHGVYGLQQGDRPPFLLQCNRNHCPTSYHTSDIQLLNIFLLRRNPLLLSKNKACTFVTLQEVDVIGCTRGVQLTGDSSTRNDNHRKETCPSATLSFINPTWSTKGLNRGLQGEMQANNLLRYGTALSSCNLLNA